MTDNPKDYILFEGYRPQWEWTDDFSKFGTDGWNYIKEWPDRPAMLGRVVTSPPKS